MYQASMRARRLEGSKPRRASPAVHRTRRVPGSVIGFAGVVGPVVPIIVIVIIVVPRSHGRRGGGGIGLLPGRLRSAGARRRLALALRSAPLLRPLVPRLLRSLRRPLAEFDGRNDRSLGRLDQTRGSDSGERAHEDGCEHRETRLHGTGDDFTAARGRSNGVVPSKAARGISPGPAAAGAYRPEARARPPPPRPPVAPKGRGRGKRV
jgi:hypothetical protein